MGKVGVRELRQNLSVYLNRVKAGETLEVTEHKHPVALLGPVPRMSSNLERLVATGKVIPAKRSHRDLPPPARVKTDGPSLSEILDQQRSDRI